MYYEWKHEDCATWSEISGAVRCGSQAGFENGNVLSNP